MIWQIFRGGAYPQGGKGRRQHHPTRAWVERILASGNDELKALVDDTLAPPEERWDFEGLSAEEQRRATAAEPLWVARPAL